MANTARLYQRIVRMSHGRLKGFILGKQQHGKRVVTEDEVLFIRVGKPLIVPQLRHDSDYVYTMKLDGKRRIVKHLGIIGEKQLLTPENLYFRAFRDSFFTKEKKKLVEQPITKRNTLDALRYWIGRASEDAPVGNYPFQDKFGSMGVNVALRTPRMGKPTEQWSTKRSEKELEQFLSPAFYDERDETGKHRILRWENEVYDRAYLNLPFPDHLALKRVNVIIKNIIKHYHIIHSEEPVVKARFNDVQGVNLISRFVEENDSEFIKYAVWDGGIVITKAAAEKLSYSKRSEVLVFESDEKVPVDKIILMKPGTEVKRFDKVLHEVDRPLWQKIMKYYPEAEERCFESYCSARISGTFNIDKETNTAFIESGERKVNLGDKLISRTGVKGVVAAIVDKLPDGFEMVIGRTKLYSKVALVKELEASKELTGKPQIFVFLRDKIAGDEFSLLTGKAPLTRAQILSDNFREAMASHEDLLYYGQIFYLRSRAENAEINEMIRPTYFQIHRPIIAQILGTEDVKMFVQDGTGSKIKEGIRAVGKEERKVTAKEQIDLFDWIPETQREKITRLPRLDLERMEYLKNPKLVQQYTAMQKRGAVYKRYIEEIKTLATQKDGTIRKFMLNPVARYSYRATLVARKLDKTTIAIPPEAAEALELGRNALVLVAREPIINYKSVGLFRIKIDPKLPIGTLALSPEVMFSFSADCDGDTMFVLPIKRKEEVLYYDFVTSQFTKLASLVQLGKHRISLLDKKDWTLVPIKKWLLEGTYGSAEDKALSRYHEVITDPDKFSKSWKPEDHLEKLQDGADKQYWSVQMVGFLRKRVIAHTQHLGHKVTAPLEELYDVELGMDKAKLFGITGTPKVGWVALTALYGLIAGKKKKIFRGLTEDEVESLEQIFRVKRLNTTQPYNIEIIIDYPKGMSPDMFGGIDIRAVEPSPVGTYFIRASMRKKERLAGLFNAFNAKDNSTYACMLRGNFDKLKLETKPEYRPYEKAADVEISSVEYLEEHSEPTDAPEQDEEVGEGG